MIDEQFNEQLARLHKAIEWLPPGGAKDRLESLARETQQRHDEIKQAVTQRGSGSQEAAPDREALQAKLGAITDALDTLRLSMAYIQFDIEAKRREDGEF
ncbi:MAG TPA: hypothetical protein VMZ31_06815 [Phycisphaerae bacterium]|nr:hypothetical protein [Phycisphaerae bacterium]